MPAHRLEPGQPIDATLIARFRADLLALTGVAPSPVGRIGIAVSGGGDSLALLLLAHAAFPDSVAAATVDHGLRAEAAAEARYVAGCCARLGVPHAILTAEFGGGGNLQDRARTARYRCLAAWAARLGLSEVATAHHRDDVAETFLMRAARGGGVRSLAAMPAVRTLAGSPVLLVRPLLGWCRVELAAIVAAAGLAPVADASNADTRFARVRMRRLLADNADLPPDRLAHAAGNLRDVEEAIEWLVLRELTARLGEDGETLVLAVDDLPFELKRRFAVRAIDAVRQRAGVFAAWRETAVPRLVRALDAGRGGTVADVVATVRERQWRFRAAPPRRRDESTAVAGK